MRTGFFQRRLFVIPASVVLLLATVIGGYFVYLQKSGNFHTVVAHELYRSAQPSSEQLASYVREHGIETVINLRGESDGAQWYSDEIATSRSLGIQHIDFEMSSSRILTPERAEQLLAIMKAAPKPILIHCQSGADRTGLVSVLYSQQIAGVRSGLAEWQLSPLYGHVAIPYFSGTYAMETSWAGLEKHFRIKG
ncbi:tyrosine-protein phosphatase [Rhizobium sp. S152]|uniref:tyrosine-protein phosphatase n=1 Tax=Rhizobium sp. S152 TaxID=3055038 RepID=UPI0025A938CB|nr:tyrosine-protein phosphatase [Rhizobium sp. S152]MDM9628577.1 tyrosine-protein phosphatase [Rhizobium sp. S152]